MNKIIILDTDNTKYEVPSIDGIDVRFHGDNANIILENPCNFYHCRFDVFDNTQIIIKSSKYKILNLNIYCSAKNFQCVIGENFCTVGTFISAEGNTGTRLTIGHDCMFSFGIHIRLDDGHTIFDLDSGLPLNSADSVDIGNHVWIGQNAIILKDTIIPDNSVIGAAAVVTSKFTESNTIIAGNPAKTIKKNIGWNRQRFSAYTEDFYAQVQQHEITTFHICEENIQLKGEVQRLNSLTQRLNKNPFFMLHPYFIHNIELTNKCIMHCAMCPRTYAMTRKQGYIDVALFKKIIDQYYKDNPQAIDRHVWLHHFGESLLHPQFDVCINYMNKFGLKPALSLNPIMLSKTIGRRLLESKPYLLYISLDGGDEKSFSAIRGVKNKFIQSKKNILNFLNTRIHEFKKDNVQIHLSIIALKGQEDNIKKAQSFWGSIPGIDKVFIKQFTTWNGDVAEIAEKGYESENVTRCSDIFQNITICWDGKVVPCCFDYNAKYILGNVKYQNLLDIWNAKPAQELRKQFLSEEITTDLCQKCTRGGHFFRVKKEMQLSELRKIKKNILSLRERERERERE